MEHLELEGEPGEVGFEGRALESIQRYFDDYVAAGRLAGWLVSVARDHKLVYVAKGGARDKERSLGVSDDTIWRLYSMTKPITTVAALMLYEEGRFDLNDEVGRWIDELAEPRVYAGGTQFAMLTEPALEPVRVHHLFTHTAGLTYGFQHLTPVDALYRAKGYDETVLVHPEGVDLAGAVHDWCSTPLLFQPGSSWNYSVATDVLGRLVEIWSGKRLDEFIQERILAPLAMVDTYWHCPADQLDRLAMLYVNQGGAAVAVPALAEVATRAPTLLMGGGGLLSTAHDFNRFMSMLLGGGELDGTRVLSPRAVSLMASNHLPGGQTLAQFARDSFSEVGQSGVGYGLGVSVVVDAVANKSLVPEGTFAWGGAASTYFWVDRREGIAAAFYAQLLPSSSYPIRRALQQLVYSALRS